MGVGAFWPDRCCAPSRTIIAREARGGMYDGLWSASFTAKIIQPFWCRDELLWARRIVPKPPVPRQGRVQTLRTGHCHAGSTAVWAGTAGD